jgi:16S rRNA (guanine966-N2)-methyltransferase
MNKRPGSANRVRLIGGSHGGRWIDFPDAAGLRPSADRTRETLFNWLQPLISGARCLDLFAGSGALGFEAASRGAAQVLMLEQAPRVAAALRQSQQALDLGQVEILQTDALRWLQDSVRNPAQGFGLAFDLVFIDPPFAQRLLPQVLQALTQAPLLRPAARIYWEVNAADSLTELPTGLSPLREKRAGQVRYGLLGWGM